MLLELRAGALAPAPNAAPVTLTLAVDAEPDATCSKESVIGIEFPAFMDGRGLSLAVLLRTRLGYQGELRAIGDTHPELFHYLYRCGFDTVLLTGTYTLQQASSAYRPHERYYQGSVRGAEPLFRREAIG